MPIAQGVRDTQALVQGRWCKQAHMKQVILINIWACRALTCNLLQAMKVLEKELHETRTTGAGAQQAAQLKTTELEASSQVSKDLQEQLSWLTTEKAAMEQRLQAKTAEVVGLHDKATTSEQQSCDLKTKNSRLEQEVGRLKRNLADVTQLNCKMSQVKLALEPVFVNTYRVHWVF